jgi:preprotein translocase subunit Sec61beta
MAKKDRMMMPQSTAGLIRYFEESEEAIKLKPEHIVIICIVVIIIVAMLPYIS